jgi:hypothetical protein
VADEIDITVCAFQLEVPIVGCQPRVEHFRNGDAPVTKDQRAWRLLAAMAGVALDANAEEAFFRQVRSPYDRRVAEPESSSTNHSVAHEAPDSALEACLDCSANSQLSLSKASELVWDRARILRC